MLHVSDPHPTAAQDRVITLVRYDLGNKKQIKLRESFKNGPVMIVFVSNYEKRIGVVLLLL